jgi:flagellar hook assembly protein FlgD
MVRDRAFIDYSVNRLADVRLSVYDAAGSLVRTLVSGRVAPGERTVAWDLMDDSGRRVANGAYFYRLAVDDMSVSEKAIVLQ